MLPIAELSAAPHFPVPLRPSAGSHALADFMTALSSIDAIEVIEENGELRLVSHAAA